MNATVDRLEAELEDLTEAIARQIIDAVPGYQSDPVAQTLLLPLVRQNADEVIRVLRGIETTTAAARNFALVEALGTTLSLESIEHAVEIARDVYCQRLRELAPDEAGLADSLSRLDEAYPRVIVAMREEYRDAKRRLAERRLRPTPPR